MNPDAQQTILTLVGNTVAAYVSGNDVPPEALPEIIRAVHAAFMGLERGNLVLAAVSAPEPAVPIKKSVFPDYLVCLEDGKKLKMLKRHLQAAYGMTPEEYRRRWNLPSTYPMVAPNYAKQRSALAKSYGLGVKSRSHEVAESVSAMLAEIEAVEPDLAIAPQIRVFRAHTRGRKKAALAAPD
jgi:predicted transcriptional regulator